MGPDIQKLKKNLIRDEDWIPVAYPDPLTGGDPWSIGVGHTGPDVREGSRWDNDKINDALNEDVAEAIGLCEKEGWWSSVCEDEVRSRAMANMMFNLGPDRLNGFKKMIAALEAEDWEGAAAEMLDSAWHKQVGDRAVRLADMIRTGKD